MDHAPAPVLVVVAGPQASGKSATAAALADALRARGEVVALVELDRIAAMALPTLPSWEVAHRITASVVHQWLRSAVTCVVAEGAGTAEEVTRLLAQAPEGAPTLTVVTTAPFEVALARAQADPTRGVSRQRAFLAAVHQRWGSERRRIDADVVLDTDVTPVERGVERVLGAIATARGARR